MVRFTKHAILTILIMTFTALLIQYVETMIVPAIPILASFFHTNYDSLSWIISAYLISGTISAAIFGRLADIYGKKKIFVILAVVYAVAVSFGGFATTLYQFIAIRTVQGLGIGMMPVALALLNDQVPKEDLPLAQGIVSSMFYVGAIFGFIIGAWITQYYGWQWSYHSAIPVAFGLAVISAIMLKDKSTRTYEKIDFVGIITLGIGVSTLILGFSEGEYWGWRSWGIIFTFVISIIFLICFVFIETKVKSPFISMKLLRIRNVFLSNFTGFFAMAALFFLFYSVVVLLEDPAPAGFHLSVINTSLIMVPPLIVSIAFVPLCARITKTRGPKVTILIGTATLFISYVGLYLYRSSPLAIMEDGIILGSGLAFIFVGVINILLVSIPKSESGAATGMNVVFRNIGSAIAPAISGVLETMYVTSIVYHTPIGIIVKEFPSHQAYNYIDLIGMAFLAVSVIFTLLMKNVIYNKNNREKTAESED